MRLALLLIPALLLAADPPAIPPAQQTAYAQATAALEKAQARLAVIEAREQQAAAVVAIVATCGDAYTPQQAQQGVVCVAKAADTT